MADSIYPHPKTYDCPKVAGSIKIDGDLDKSVWQTAKWTDWFEDIEGPKKPSPRYKTRAKMIWTDEGLCIGAQLEEPHLWGTLTKRDSVIFQDNDFEVFLDPDGDNQRYYEFEINVLNTGWDLLLIRPYRDGGPAVNGWDIQGIQTAVRTKGTVNDPSDIDEGWTVEIFFPWPALAECAGKPCPPRSGDVWRINFSRVEWDLEVVDGKYHKIAGRPEHNWVWSPQWAIDMHRPEHWGYLRFVEQGQVLKPFVDPEHHGRSQLMDLYQRQRSFRDQHGRWASVLSELGLDAKSGIVLEVAGSAFEARLSIPIPGDGRRQLRLREDSRLEVVDLPTPQPD